jgi:hypothetical protein
LSLCFIQNSKQPHEKSCHASGNISASCNKMSVGKVHAYNRPQGPKVVPGRLRPRIFLTFGTTRVVGRQPHAPAAFTPRKDPWYSFLEAESTPGHMVPSVVTEKNPQCDTTRTVGSHTFTSGRSVAGRRAQGQCAPRTRGEDENLHTCQEYSLLFSQSSKSKHGD